MDKTNCRGCVDDVYNGGLADECWSFKRAQIVTRYRTGIWTLPDSKGAFVEMRVPTCYRQKGYSFSDRLPDFVRAENVIRKVTP